MQLPGEPAAEGAPSPAGPGQRLKLEQLEEEGSSKLRQEHAGERLRESGELDPLARSLASQAAKTLPPAPPPASTVLPVEFEQLMRELVRRAAWGGDRRRGTARIELGAGELAGATLLVEADRHDLRIDLELPAGVPAEPWRARLASRLSERGFSVRELHVH